MSTQENQPRLPTLTTSQLDTYLSRISFPITKYPRPTAAATQTSQGLEFLTRLQKHHLNSIPFENLSLHYNNFPGISIDIDDIYEKIVIRRRGGYCMEQNLLFAVVLRTLGYEVVQGGGRVFDPLGEEGGGVVSLPFHLFIISFTHPTKLQFRSL